MSDTGGSPDGRPTFSAKAGWNDASGMGGLNLNNRAPVQIEAGGRVMEIVAKFNSGDGFVRQCTG
jgi:hypothetical protein